MPSFLYNNSIIALVAIELHNTIKLIVSISFRKITVTYIMVKMQHESSKIARKLFTYYRNLNTLLKISAPNLKARPLQLWILAVLTGTISSSSAAAFVHFSTHASFSGFW